MGACHVTDNSFFAYSPLINSKSSHISCQQIFYALVNKCPFPENKGQ